MAGEWVNTAVGGAVGVVGTLGATWLTQRREDRAETRRRRHQVQDERRQEKREVFLRLLAAVNTLESAALSAHRTGASAEQRATIDAHLAMARLTGDADLVCDGTEVSGAWLAVCGDANRVVARALESPPGTALIDGMLTANLVREMKKELDASRA